MASIKKTSKDYCKTCGHSKMCHEDEHFNLRYCNFGEDFKRLCTCEKFVPDGLAQRGFGGLK